MNSAKGALFVGLGLFVLWLAATGKLGNLSEAWQALKGGGQGTITGKVNAGPHAGVKAPAQPSIFGDWGNVIRKNMPGGANWPTSPVSP